MWQCKKAEAIMGGAVDKLAVVVAEMKHDIETGADVTRRNPREYSDWLEKHIKTGAPCKDTCARCLLQPILAELQRMQGSREEALKLLEMLVLAKESVCCDPLNPVSAEYKERWLPKTRRGHELIALLSAPAPKETK